MSDLSEQEKYALFANVPYLMHEGVPQSVIEEDLKAYGLDYKIDPELSDRLSATLVSDADIVHSVRGTDPHSLKDLISDVGIVASHPTAIKLANTLSVISGFSGLFPYISGNLPVSAEVKEGYYELFKNYDGLTGRGEFADWEEGPQWSHEEWRDEVARLANVVTQRKIREAGEQKIKGTITGASLLGTTYALSQSKKLITDSVRTAREKEKLNLIKEKYKDIPVSLTGHSLGSVVNVLGRKENIKTITFNPAPQQMEETTEAHPESRIYRTRRDPVSYFLTEQDTEPKTVIQSKYMNTHSLTNFLPESRPKARIRQIPQMTFKPPEVSFCDRFPDNPKCKQRMYFAV